ncbi:EutP/PduV family microcompartment system protein [Lutispora saccharofermentans]|uniref:EutP/PduV family microcompartment system protein n=1 Tax=Lutispora saccharofermentans TaxID=3024236 RepID=A0ABT1NE95_9FIRM|nr:EutP/PduV family microcompartment system protein [Lutispora saccharofermentans]MCQ1529567.1 EutP/PduV family microcompartment system protein [Lutispora saccharofermentans]
MKSVILIGKSGAGKTTLIQKLLNQPSENRKTQSLEFFSSMIDTPGEYLENKSYYKALLVSSIECDAILLLQDPCDEVCFYPPGFATMFNKHTIGVITKIDRYEGNIESAMKCLTSAGADRIFMISSYTEEGLYELKKYLEYL